METRKLIILSFAFLLLTADLSPIIAAGMKGGNGAVELLLATGILAKLFQHTKKHGAYRITPMLNALFGGHRYHPRHHGILDGFHRYRGSHGSHSTLQAQALLQENMLDQHSLPLSLAANEHELLMNDESQLLEQGQVFLPSTHAQQLRRPLLADTQVLSASDARHILAAQNPANLLAAQNSINLLAAQNSINLLAAESPTTVLAAQTPAAVLAAQTPAAVLAAQTPAAVLAAQTPTAVLSAQTPTAFLSAQTPTAFLSAQTPGNLLSVQEAQNLFSAQEARQLMAAQNLRRLLAAQNARRLLAAQRARQLLKAQETRHLLAASSSSPLLTAEGARYIFPLSHSPTQFYDQSLLMKYYGI